MGGATTRVPMSQRVLSPSHNYGAGDYHAGSDQPAVLLSGSIFRFLEEETNVYSSPETDGHTEIQNEIEDDDENQNPERIEDKIKFWETQYQSLHSTLYRTTSLESKIRSITKEVAGIDGICSCSRVVSGSCRSCRMREICSRLASSGYNSAICKSKWKSSVEIPSGEHTFVDVIDNSNSKKGEVRVIIELEFRGQFEMKKGSEEYNDLVSKLPDIFVSKIERLQTVIKILSNAAKRCMKEKKMHLGPWRKQKYVEAKWLRVVDRNTCMSLTTPLMAVDTFPIRKTRARESMLTMDLLDNFHMYTSVC